MSKLEMSQTIGEILRSQEFQEYQEQPENQYHKINAQQMMKTPVFFDCIVAPDGYSFVELDFCFVSGTEILTQKGWKVFKELTESDLVWQVDPNSLRGEWVKPLRIIQKEYTGDIHWFGNRRGNLGVTSGHTMLWAGQQTHKRKDKALLRKITKSEQGIPRTATTLLTSSVADTVSNFSEYEIWMSCMLAADGSQAPSGNYNIQVSKKRKVEKVTELLGKKGAKDKPHGAQKLSPVRWSGIKFSSELLCPRTKTLRLNKLGANQAGTFIAALSFWDSHKLKYKSNRFNFFSSDLKQVEHIQQYLVTAGFEAKLKHSYKPKDIKHKDGYTLSVRKAVGLRLRSECDHSIEKVEKMTVGCVTVPSGFIQVRYQGQTFISGNCSLEPSIMAEFSQDPTYIELFASGKPHCVYLYVACKLLDPDGKITQVYQPDSPVPNVAEAKKLFKSERSIAKVVHLMSAYKAGAPAIQRKINITGGDISKEQAYDLRERYWGPELFGGVLEYEQHLLHEVKQRGGWLVNGLGRPLVVTEKKAKDVLNTVCQATGHDCLDIYVNKLEPLIISSGIPAVPIIPDWHDETVWMCPTSDAPRLAEIFIQAMHETNKELGFGIPLRGEPEITKTFTQFKNPDPSTDNWYENKLEKLK